MKCVADLVKYKFKRIDRPPTCEGVAILTANLYAIDTVSERSNEVRRSKVHNYHKYYQGMKYR